MWSFMSFDSNAEAFRYDLLREMFPTNVPKYFMEGHVPFRR